MYKIITISSDAGLRQFQSLAVYCASKAFVETLSEREIGRFVQRLRLFCIDLSNGMKFKLNSSDSLGDM